MYDLYKKHPYIWAVLLGMISGLSTSVIFNIIMLLTKIL